MRPRLRHALVFVAALVPAYAFTIGCALTGPQRALVVSIEGALCSALLPLAWPGGGSADALVCQGSEGILAAALASLPAPAANAPAGPSSPGAGPPPPMVRRPVHRAGKLVGFVPAERSPVSGPRSAGRRPGTCSDMARSRA